MNAEQFSEEALRIGTSDAAYFVTRFHPGRPIHLSAIDVAGKYSARTFAPGEADEMSHWIKAQQNRSNVYFSVNGVRAELRNKKAKKEDITEAYALHVDIDDMDGLARLTDYHIKPSLIVFTGGGYQAFWLLEEPSRDLDRVERINSNLARDLGGDNCGNCDRIMRMPGTVNVLSEKKRRAGRTPAMAKLQSAAWERRYSIDLFLDEVEPLRQVELAATVEMTHVVPTAVSDLPEAVSAATRRLVELGDDEERPRGSEVPRFKSRSEAVWRVVCDLARSGCDVAMIAGILINPIHRISESISEKPKPIAYALKQATAALQAVGDAWPDVDRVGRPRATMLNTALALQRLELVFAFDLFRHRKTVGGLLLEDHQGEISDEVCVRLRDAVIERFGFDPKSENVRDAVDSLCLANKHGRRTQLRV